MKISELLPHQAVQAAEKAEQQSSSREDGTSIAENFKRHLDQNKGQATAAGIDPLQARNNRDEESFRNNMDRDATLKAQEHQDDYRADDAPRQDADTSDNRRDDIAPAREERANKDDAPRDRQDDTADSGNTDNEQAKSGETGQDESNTDQEAADDSQDNTGQSDGEGEKSSAQENSQDQNGQTNGTEQAATETGPQIETVAAGTGLEAAAAAAQNAATDQNQRAFTIDNIVQARGDGKTTDPAILQQQAMAAKTDPNAQANGDAGDKQLSRTALAQAVRNQVLGQTGQGEQNLAGQNMDDGADADLQSLTQRSLAAEKGKAQQGTTQTGPQNKAADMVAQNANAQVAAQKVDAAMDRLADVSRGASAVRSGGQEMTQTQATTQTQSNIAATASGQQSVDSAAKVVTLSTPRGAAHMPPTQQVAIHIAKGLEAGANKININLKPAELGRVEVQLDIAKDGTVAVRVTADRQETLDLLKQDSSSLEDALKEAGLDLNEEDMEFNLREDREGDLAKEEAGDGEDDDDAEASNNTPEDEGRELTPEETRAAIRQAILDRSINITV